MFPACSATGALQMTDPLGHLVQRATRRSSTGAATDLRSSALIGAVSYDNIP